MPLLVFLRTARSSNKNGPNQVRLVRNSREWSSLNAILAAAAGDEPSNELCFVKKRIDIICRESPSDSQRCCKSVQATLEELEV